MSPVQRPERRHFVRVRFGGPIRAEPIPHPATSRVRHLLCADLSEGGVRLSSPAFLPADSLLLLDLDYPSSVDPIRAVGRVAWAQQAPFGDWRCVGVELGELSEDARSRLRRIVRRRQVVRLR